MLQSEDVGNVRQVIGVIVQSVVAGMVAAGLISTLVAGGARSPEGVARLWPETDRLAKVVRSGDLVFRRGPSLASRLVLLRDPRSPYSHVGLLRVDSARHVLVLHTLPAIDGIGGAMEEDVREFLALKNADSWAAYRVMEVDSKTAAMAATIAAEWAKSNVPFDHRFDSRSTESMYCTVFVQRAFRAAGIELVPARQSQARMADGAELVLVSDLLRNKLQLIAKQPDL